MSREIMALAAKAGVTLFDYQMQALLEAQTMTGRTQRLCLYYKTGAGKSLTALGCMSLWGFHESLVIAPPATHDRWVQWGRQVDIKVYPMSHAKFRMPDTRLSRTIPVIADEMHLFGGHTGKGWKKLDQLARHLQAPLVMASATPNYNDAERCYCIQHILDPIGTKGGFLEFVYRNCSTEQNAFGEMPKVTGFLHYQDAAAFLADLPGVKYLEDDLVFTIDDITVPPFVSPEMDLYGYNEREHRMLASQMEEKHARNRLALVDDNGLVHDHIYKVVMDLVRAASTPVLVFSAFSTVAEALYGRLCLDKVSSVIVTGDLTSAQKQRRLAEFVLGHVKVLVGTASLATGTDGLNTVCDTLIILQDTEDPSLRRQLIGRIMPRGDDADVLKKRVYRLVQQ
jgi:hypothetical protein